MEKKRTYGVWAVRSSTSIFGPAQSWCKENGKPLEFDTKAAAENYAKEANEHTTAITTQGKEIAEKELIRLNELVGVANEIIGGAV